MSLEKIKSKMQGLRQVDHPDQNSKMEGQYFFCLLNWLVCCGQLVVSVDSRDHLSTFPLYSPACINVANGLYINYKTKN